ncbi:MAG: ferrous iron transport protein B [candidate division Zixibacteria bacterium]|nr:ferrous iron transport protein B [candidate division Zixibacteria bacterium]
MDKAIVPTTSSSPGATRRIILVGNPNVGKSVIFSLLTGQYVTVSNYPGTTVEISRGRARGWADGAEVIDTPGILSLEAASEDERVTVRIIEETDDPLIIHVADAKNLRRSLLLTLPLIEMGFPVHLNLNMIDEAESRGVKIDARRLSRLLGIGVSETAAIQKRGIDRLKRGLTTIQRGAIHIDYGPVIEDAVERISAVLPTDHVSPRSRALTMLCQRSGGHDLPAMMDDSHRDRIETVLNDCRVALGQDPVDVISRQRLTAADRIVREVLTTAGDGTGRFRNWLGRIAMHPLWGIPLLVLILLVVYEFVGVFGAGVCVTFLENTVFGNYINPFLAHIFAFIPWAFVRDMLVGPYGLFTMALTYAVAIVLPVVGTFFIVFGILEDTGYLPRLAFMVDRIFRLIGLNGKAVLPMILGLGCDTMATLTTRILETKRERVLVTLLLALGVPCSAQLGVILGMLAGLSPAATLIWAGTVIGILFLVGLLYSLLSHGKRSDFILEIPPIRRPQLSNIALKTMARVEWYLKEAVPLFALGTLILFLLDYSGLLARLETALAPVMTGVIGLPKEVAGPFLIGFLRRDYGAAGLFVLARGGALDPIQIVVSLVIITLFVPCIANFFVIIKERGLKTALAMTAFIFPFAFFIGAVLNLILRGLKVTL